ncbi:hypothetical protein [Streptomyces sp. NPDC020681]|uniref:hypothetical protein n=1 Tax=Streptomyces sp. NPDC020681 TaxID=3365083 RepID=UPI003798DEC3
MITQEDIARVALELEQAEDTVTKLRLKRYITSAAGASYAAAKGRIELVRGELERLNVQYEAEQQALADRPDVEKAAAKEIGAAKKELEASHDALATAASTAQQALLDLYGAAEAHNALIARHSAALTVRGLAVEEGRDHQTGGGRDGLRIRGVWWVPVQSVALLTWVTDQVAAVCWPRGTGMRSATGRHALERRSDGLLGKVAKLPAPAPAEPRPKRAKALGAPVYFRNRHEAEEAASSELRDWGRDVPANVRASVERRLRQLEEDIASGQVILRSS